MSIKTFITSAAENPNIINLQESIRALGEVMNQWEEENKGKIQVGERVHLVYEKRLLILVYYKEKDVK